MKASHLTAVVGIVIALALAVWAFSSVTAPQSESDSFWSLFAGGARTAATPTPTPMPAEPEDGPRSMRQLLTGVAQRCTFSDANGEAQTSGTVYAAGGAMKGDFVVRSGGMTFNSHLIIRDETIYSWTEGIPTGFKIQMRATGNNSGQQGSVDPDKSFNFTCEKWTADNMFFELPSIEFTDASSLSAGNN